MNKDIDFTEKKKNEKRYDVSKNMTQYHPHTCKPHIEHMNITKMYLHVI